MPYTVSDPVGVLLSKAIELRITTTDDSLPIEHDVLIVQDFAKTVSCFKTLSVRLASYNPRFQSLCT